MGMYIVILAFLLGCIFFLVAAAFCIVRLKELETLLVEMQKEEEIEALEEEDLSDYELDRIKQLRNLFGYNGTSDGQEELKRED